MTGKTRDPCCGLQHYDPVWLLESLVFLGKLADMTLGLPWVVIFCTAANPTEQPREMLTKLPQVFKESPSSCNKITKCCKIGQTISLRIFTYTALFKLHCALVLGIGIGIDIRILLVSGCHVPQARRETRESTVLTKIYNQKKWQSRVFDQKTKTRCASALGCCEVL